MFTLEYSYLAFLILGWAGFLGLAGMVFCCAFTGVVLRYWGKSTKGKVVSCLEVRMTGGPFYLISYEFNFSNSNGVSQKQTGKHGVRWTLQPKDIVAIRYWVHFPKVNRIFERHYP